MSLLPTKKTEARTEDPRNLMMYGLPKCGKSSSIAQMPDTLILDLEDGYAYLSAYVVPIRNYVDFYKICKALREEEHNYKFVVIDTITELENLAADLGAENYKKTLQGKNFMGTGKDLLNLPMGAGYKQQKDALKQMLSWIMGDPEKGFVPTWNTILVGHVKDSQLGSNDDMMPVKALDVSKSCANMLSKMSDTIAYVYRDSETNNLMANFGDKNEVLTGARPKHLSGKTVLLAERVLNEDGDYDIVTHWDNIFKSLAKN
jgi:hypothetical protein